MATDEVNKETLQERVDRDSRTAKAILEEIKRQHNKADRDGRTFTAVTEEQLLSKLRSVNSPMIVWQSWSSSGTVGSTIKYSVGITNPDAVDAVYVFAHVFVGAANIARNIGEALSAVDTRFPRLTMPAFPGVTIKAGGFATLDFALTIPAGAQKTNYMGNSVLYRATWHDPAVYLDRGLFVFEVA